MAREYKDLVQDVSTTAGTVAFVPAGTPPTGCQAFSAHTAGAVFDYKAVNGAQWEVGTGTWNGTNIARSPTASSNAGALVNFATAPTLYEVVDAASVADFARLSDGVSFATYLAANPGSTPTDSDSFPFVQGTSVVGQQFGATASAVNKRWVNEVDQVIEATTTATVTLDRTVHNRRRLVFTAAGSVAAPSSYASVGDGFRCEVTNLSGTPISIGTISGLPSGSSIPNNVTSRVFAFKGALYADLPSGTAQAAATVTSVTVSPSTASLPGGGTQTFTATVAGTNSPAQNVTWSATGGTITGGAFTAPAATSSAQTITVTATSTVDNTKAGTATVTVAANTSTVTGVSISPTTPTVSGGATQQFTATVTGTGSPSQAVVWAAGNGTITNGGLFTAPLATGAAQSVNIAATSAQNNGISANTTVTVPAQTITVNTPSTSPTVGTAYTLSGTYTGPAPTAIDYRTTDNAGTPSAWTATTSPVISGGTWSCSITPTTSSTSRVITVRDHVNTSVTGSSGAYVVNAAAAGGGSTGVAPFTATANATFPVALASGANDPNYLWSHVKQAVTGSGPTVVTVKGALSKSNTAIPTSALSQTSTPEGAWIGTLANYNGGDNYLVIGGTASDGTQYGGIKWTEPTANYYYWLIVTDSAGATWYFVSPVSIAIGNPSAGGTVGSIITYTQVQQ